MAEVMDCCLLAPSHYLNQYQLLSMQFCGISWQQFYRNHSRYHLKQGKSESPCDLEIWWMSPKNNWAPLLCYFKLFASFRSHWWIQTGVTVRKRLIWVKLDDFFSCVPLKFDGWPSKTIGRLFYATSSFVHHFVAIDDFKLELQSGNA